MQSLKQDDLNVDQNPPKNDFRNTARLFSKLCVMDAHYLVMPSMLYYLSFIICVKMDPCERNPYKKPRVYIS